MTLGFDDSVWQEAHAIPQRELEWFLLEAREVPLLHGGSPGQVDIPELLAGDIQLPLLQAVVKDADSLLEEGQRPAVFQGRVGDADGIRVPYIVLDFGRQVFGFPRIRFEAERGAILDVTYGQQLIQGRIPPGSFACSDETLTDLWKACPATTRLNLEDTLVHEGYRERAVWSTGDGSHIMLMVLASYGSPSLTDRFLRIFPLSERGDGMLQMAFSREASRTLLAH